MHDFISRADMPAVLLIDDDMVSREVMATVLTMSGYPVHTAPDGDSALTTLQAEANAPVPWLPAIILMDAQMPGLSGIPLIQQLRRQSPAPIYAMSASDIPADLLAAANGFLRKPFGPEALAALLGEQAPPNKPQPAPGLDPNEPIFDAKTLGQLREMMPEKAVKQIYEAILSDLNKRITSIEAAMARADWPELRRLGHAIKGGALMAGAVQIARLGELLESGAVGPNKAGTLSNPVNHSDNSPAIVADLRAAALNLQRMLDAEFKA